MQKGLTTKEFGLLSDILTAEENLCKKARVYSKILTDPVTAEKMKVAADNSAKRYAGLLGLLN